MAKKKLELEDYKTQVDQLRDEINKLKEERSEMASQFARCAKRYNDLEREIVALVPETKIKRIIQALYPMKRVVTFEDDYVEESSEEE